MRFLIIGSAISLAVFLMGSFFLWGLSHLVIIGLALGALIGIGKSLLTSRVVTGLLRKDASSRSVTLLNIIFYILSWVIIIFLFVIAMKIATQLLLALAAGILIVPLVMMVYAVLKGAGIIRPDL
ncbi:MAG: hypothetical protein WCL54_04545 [Clostridia bacterium]